MEERWKPSVQLSTPEDAGGGCRGGHMVGTHDAVAFHIPSTLQRTAADPDKRAPALQATVHVELASRPPVQCSSPSVRLNVGHCSAVVSTQAHVGGGARTPATEHHVRMQRVGSVLLLHSLPATPYDSHVRSLGPDTRHPRDRSHVAVHVEPTEAPWVQLMPPFSSGS